MACAWQFRQFPVQPNATSIQRLTHTRSLLWVHQQPEWGLWQWAMLRGMQWKGGGACAVEYRARGARARNCERSGMSHNPTPEAAARVHGDSGHGGEWGQLPEGCPAQGQKLPRTSVPEPALATASCGQQHPKSWRTSAYQAVYILWVLAGVVLGPGQPTAVQLCGIRGTVVWRYAAAMGRRCRAVSSGSGKLP